MRIAIDFREAAKPTRAGKGEYVFQIVSQMLPQLEESEELLLLLETGQTATLPTGSWRAVVVPARSWLWQILVIVWFIFAKPADIYFATLSAIAPAFLWWRLPVITTLFDFTVWRFPGTHLERTVRLEKMFMPQAIRRSKALLAISQFTKQEAVELFGTSPDRITVTELAVNESFQPLVLAPEAITRLQQRYKLPNKFLLYLGTLEPRKNLTRVVAAFKKSRDQLGDTKLVLAGGLGWKTMPATLADPDIILTGYIDDADRAAIYNLATAFVFPSLYEGFGLPPLEAMACGTPVITSNAASLPEVVGAAALLVDPNDTDSIAASMVKIVQSSELKDRLSRAGQERARDFNWTKTARETLRVLRLAARP